MHARPRAAGFTLAELATVLVVIGILSGVAVTSLNGLAGARQDVAATRIRTVLVHAQEWAMGTNLDTWVVFDVAGESASVYVEDPAQPGKANRVALADPLTLSALTLQLGSDGVGIESAAFGATSEVQFEPSGTPRDANGNLLTADGTVGVTGGGIVRVTRNTGLVTVD